MMRTKVKKCTYSLDKKGNTTIHNITVQGNTEGAVKEYLQKRHRNKEITIKEIQWA